MHEQIETNLGRRKEFIPFPSHLDPVTTVWDVFRPSNGAIVGMFGAFGAWVSEHQVHSLDVELTCLGSIRVVAVVFEALV